MQLIERNTIQRGDDMNINKSYISNNNSYAGQVPKYIVIHNTDNYAAGADALTHAKAQYNGNFSGYSAHVYVDDKSAYQATPFNRGAWHVGVNYGGRLFGTVNNRNSIGIEMCVQKGYNYEKAFQNTVQTCKQIMKETGIPSDRVVTHFDVCNKNCPSAIRAKGDWSRFKKLISSSSSQSEDTSKYTKITGKSKATVKQMTNYIKSKNPKVTKSVIDMIPLYLSEGEAEGIRGDIAFAQSCLETGNFTFSGSAVTLDQNNFCGMGVTSTGVKGNSFKTPQLGIRAQIQHLKAYANKSDLKNKCVDPRFKYVERGCAEYVEWLGMKENPKEKGWADGVKYGSKILTILKAIGGGSSETKPEVWYRVRKTWADSKSQKGAYKDLKNAKKCADENLGYSVFDENGKKLYTGKKNNVFKTYKVKVEANDLRIRTGPGTNYVHTNEFTGPGVFTIVEESAGKGSKKGWGRLKSGAGWISLDYAKKI